MDVKSIYAQLKEERAAKKAEFDGLDAAEQETRVAEFQTAFDAIDSRSDALMNKLVDDKNAAERDAKLAGLIASREDAPAVSDALSGDAAIAAEIRAAGLSLENRAPVEVPTFLDSDEFYGKSIIPEKIVNDFVKAFDVKQTPYRIYTEQVQALGNMAFSPATEAVTLTENAPALAALPTLTTAKQGLIYSLSQELLEAIPGIEKDIVAEVNLAWAKEIRASVVSAVNAGTNTVATAAADATIVEAIELLWDTYVAEDRSDVILLASTLGMADLATDAGNDAFYYDHKSQSKVLQGIKVWHAPNLGGATVGDTVVAALNPKAVSVRASKLRLAKDLSVGFNDDVVSYRATAYSGSAINSQDHVALLTKGA